MGARYESGSGVPQDLVEAASWYCKGADQGNADAQFSLARLYAQGHGVPLDYVQARVLFARAAAGITDDEAFRQEAIRLRDQAASLIPSPRLLRNDSKVG